MKPLRLTMTAFGPYAGTQELDFTQLDQRSLLLIAGPTGSGKTTILDAMCYALYGVTSGKEREGGQMRSQHSDPRLLTEVTFDFALGADQYRVWRRPQQTRAKKRGEGTTAEIAKAALWKRTGVAAEAEGQPLATRAHDVDELVVRLLGFQSDQFRQVVLLPQGQFRQLLLADSRARQEILETLFQTEVFRRIEEALKAARREIERELDTRRIGRQRLLQTAGVESVEALEQRRGELAQRAEQLAETLTIARQRKAAADTAHQAGRETQARLDERDKARRVDADLESRAPQIAAQKTRRERAQRAAGLQDLDAQRRQRKQEHDEAEAEVVRAQQARQQADAAHAEAGRRLARERGRPAEAEQLQKELNRLEGFVALVADLGRTRAAWTQAQRDAERCRQAKQTAARKGESLGEDLSGLQQRLADAVKLAAAEPARRMSLEQAQQQRETQAELRKVQQRVGKLQAELQTAQGERDRAQAALEAAQQMQRTLELQFEESAAARLASKLQPGQPCPVCGSPDHPAPAQAAGAWPDEGQRKQQRETVAACEAGLEKARTAVTDRERKLDVAGQQQQSLTAALGDKADVPAAVLQQELKQREADLQAAAAATVQIPALERQIRQLTADRQRAAEAAKEADQQLEAAARTEHQLAGQVQQQESAVPAELRAGDALTAACRETAERIQQSRQAWEDAQRQHQEAARQLAAGTSRLTAAETARDRARATADAAGAAFQQRLEAAGFAGESAYAAAQLTAAQVAVLEQEIQQYQRDRAAAEDRLARAEQDAAGLTPPDLAALAQEAHAAGLQVEENLQAATMVQNQLTQSGTWLQELRTEQQQLAELEERFTVVGGLAEVATGDNPANLTFQRFVLGALLDDVLRAASNRLTIMSRGRYQLRRQQELADRRRAAGLDLEVDDAYTGQTRPACTLSGGESFLAALALALGLADVVQSYAGGIRLDAIFIDEGFGSLDSDALDDALRALIDLQKAGRLVGIISHVPELKERIDVRLEITADKRGSTARFVLS